MRPIDAEGVSVGQLTREIKQAIEDQYRATVRTLPPEGQRMLTAYTNNLMGAISTVKEKYTR